MPLQIISRSNKLSHAGRPRSTGKRSEEFQLITISRTVELASYQLDYEVLANEISEDHAVLLKRKSFGIPTIRLGWL